MPCLCCGNKWVYSTLTLSLETDEFTPDPEASSQRHTARKRSRVISYHRIPSSVQNIKNYEKLNAGIQLRNDTRTNYIMIYELCFTYEFHTIYMFESLFFSIEERA